MSQRGAYKSKAENESVYVSVGGTNTEFFTDEIYLARSLKSMSGSHFHMEDGRRPLHEKITEIRIVKNGRSQWHEVVVS